MLNFTVVLLGPSGAGKSTLLSSMNESISSRPLSDSFSVRADPVTNNRLTTIYRQVSDTARGWPTRNHCDDMVELSFIGCVDSSTDNSELYEIRYLDYDGGCLDEQRVDSRLTKRLAEKIKQADALLCLLDGEHTIDLLRNSPTGRHYFDSTMASVWRHVSTGSAPLHFVITKWDLVEQYADLEGVRDALMQVDGFASVVRRALDTRSATGRRIIRLIPVSAVGREFAAPGAEGGMVKVPGASISPLNTSIPFLAVLPDVLRTAMADQRKNLEKAEKRNFLRTVHENSLIQSLLGAGAQRSVQKALTDVPLWTRGGLAKLGEFVRARGGNDLGRWIADRGAWIGAKRIRHSGIVASGLVFFAAVAFEVMKERSNHTFDPETWRKYSVSLDQAVRAYELELERFREHYPASHLADLESVYGARAGI